MKRGLVGLGLAAAIAASAAALAPTAHAQDKAVQLKLSSWVPPAHPLSPVAAGLGGGHQEGLGRHDHGDAVSSEQLGKAFDHYDMARDGIADFAYVNPGYQPGRFPVIAARRAAVPVRQRQGRLGGDRRLVPAIRGQGDEGRAFLLRLRARSRHLPQRTRRSSSPTDIKGLKVRPATQHDRPDGDPAGRHQRAGLGARGARRARARRRRRDHVSVGLDRAVRHRQGREVPHGRGALRHHRSSG